MSLHPRAFRRTPAIPLPEGALAFAELSPRGTIAWLSLAPPQCQPPREIASIEDLARLKRSAAADPGAGKLKIFYAGRGRWIECSGDEILSRCRDIACRSIA